MRNKLREVLVALAGAAVTAAAFYAAPPTEGQAPASRIPRTSDGRPNLNGIWQALNTANYDIEAHLARPALAMRPGPVIPVPAREVVALGAVGSVPAGVGVVVGGAVPYTPEGLAKKKENQDNWLTRIPRSNAICLVFHARHTCRFRCRFFKATRRSSSRTNMPAPSGTFT